MTTRRATTLSLAAALYGFVCLSALLFGVVTAYLVFDRAQVVQESALAAAVDVRGRHAAFDLARALNQDWQNLKIISEQLALRDPASLRAALDLTVGDGSRVSWAGFAGPDGVVVASSNGILMEADVADRPWFQRGLGGDFAGDVHDAVLLNRILGGTEAEPLRFIDLAIQVIEPDGNVKGVLGFHINFAWAEAYLAAAARSLELDLFLVNQAGDVIVATDSSVVGTPQIPTFRAAAVGVSHSGREVWPDGKTYFTSVVPQVTHGDLPSFGWRLVARISPDAFDGARVDLTRQILKVLASAGLLLLLLTVLFSRMFIRPLEELAGNAQRIADGSDEYPFENRSTAEVAALSAALARLQGRQG
jgi:HAMP domain